MIVGIEGSHLPVSVFRRCNRAIITRASLPLIRGRCSIMHVGIRFHGGGPFPLFVSVLLLIF
jgi:hypothetical protein